MKFNRRCWMIRLMLPTLALTPANGTVIIVIPTASGILVGSDSRHLTEKGTPPCDSWTKIFVSDRPQTVFALHGDIDLFHHFTGDPCKIAPVFSIKNPANDYLKSVSASTPLTQEVLRGLALAVLREITNFENNSHTKLGDWVFSVIVATATPTLVYGLARGQIRSGVIGEPIAVVRDGSPSATSDLLIQAPSQDFARDNIYTPLRSLLHPLIGQRISPCGLKLRSMLLERS